MIKIPAGSRETLIVDVVDKIGSITTLDDASGVYSYRLRGDVGNWIQTGLPIVNTGMRAYCFIDTTGLEVGIYELFLDFTANGEVPRMGPHEFEVAFEQ